MKPATPFVFVTGNPNKLIEAQRILGFRPEAEDIDLPEVQSLDLREVVEAKAEEAWRRIGRPVVVEETGLELDAMNGFPGPLVKWMLDAIGPVGIASTAHALDQPGVTARCLLLYRDAERKVLGEGATRGHLVLEPRGEHGFGWDPIFVPEGQTQTYAELSDDAKNSIGHRGRAWRDFQNKLKF